MPKFGRRSFARGVGAAALFSPFVSLLNPTKARAAQGKAKYLLIFHTTGTALDLWRPVGSSESQIVFSEMLEPLSAIRGDLVIIEGLDSKGTANNHGQPGGLTGMDRGSNMRVSLDQFVGDRLAQRGVVTPFSSLIMGGVSSERQTTFFRYSSQALSPLFSPVDAYSTIFNGVGAGLDNTVPPEIRLARRQSILDVVNAELTELSGALGAEERAKLDLHAASIRELEDRLELAAGGGGEAAGDCSELPSPGDTGELLANSALHADLAVSAFSCDLTRVAAIQFGHHQSTQVGLTEIGSGDWHNFLHGRRTQELINLERYICQQFVDVAQRLKSLPAPDGTGTLFDQTLMIWTRGMGDAVNHSGSDMRFVLSGGAGGYLQTSPEGRYLQGGGEAHQRVLFNCCEAMGVTNFAGFGSTSADVGAREPLSSIGA